MLKYILTGAGGILFLAGYYFYDKYRNTGRTMRIYALFAYAGLSMMVLGGARILDPYLEMLPGSMGTFVSLGGQAALFVCGAEWILKPAFEDQKKKKGGFQGEESEEKERNGGKNKGGSRTGGTKRVRKRKGKGRNKKRF